MITKTKHKAWKSGKVLKRENSLREIFKERTNAKLGLTKKETIAKYYNFDIRDVLKYEKKKTDSLWKEIHDTKRKLRKERIIAIVPMFMSSGTQLDDSHLENPISTKPRILGTDNWVYHSCTDKNLALSFRKKNDKIIDGIDKASDDVDEITETGIQQIPVLKVMNERITAK